MKLNAAHYSALILLDRDNRGQEETQCKIYGHHNFQDSHVQESLPTRTIPTPFSLLASTADLLYVPVGDAQVHGDKFRDAFMVATVCA